MKRAVGAWSFAGALFRISAKFWLSPQGIYEIRLAKKKSGKMIQALPTMRDLRAA